MIQFSMLETNGAALFSEIFFLLISSQGDGNLCMALVFRLGVNRTSHYESTTVIKWPAGDLNSSAFCNTLGCVSQAPYFSFFLYIYLSSFTVQQCLLIREQDGLKYDFLKAGLKAQKK